MKFSFKKYLIKLFILDIFINLFVILFFIIPSSSNISFISLLILSLTYINIIFIKRIYEIKIFLKNQPSTKIKKLEKDLSNNYLIYDSWYLTDEYMFSLENLEKVDYKDILVIEGGLSLISGMNNLGYKQTIYLKNGKKYKLKSHITSSTSDIFTDFLKKKNSNIYFGIIEDYMKKNRDDKNL